jgi:uncharacterized damage-inducible protein DinB
MDDRFPVGRYERPGALGDEERRALIAQVAETPARLADAIGGWPDERLDTPYRDGGWTVRQVVHHLPDSHLNAYVRMKLALTEQEPAVKTYDEAAWADLPDSRDTPVAVSQALLDALHRRWVALMQAMTPEQWRRTIRHPEWGAMNMEELLALYAWHGRHHVAHVTRLAERMGW